jgi:hypothetical protein
VCHPRCVVNNYTIVRTVNEHNNYGMVLQKLALTSPTGGGRSVGIVRSRTKATDFSLVLLQMYLIIHKYSIVVVAVYYICRLLLLYITFVAILRGQFNK